MGTGHVMRCLTLAEALAGKGIECHFICREHVGNLIGRLRDKGFYVHTLPVVSVFEAETDRSVKGNSIAHSDWLGATQHEDADACISVLEKLRPDWLIVDSYSLDSEWELILKPYYRRLMVIDDLADRAHQCDLLLDQTFGRDSTDYHIWVSPTCELLCGSQYALLRPEFAALRSYSLQRRRYPGLRQLLISLGGVDVNNITAKLLDVLRDSPLPDDCQITVIMGSTGPWLHEVRVLAQGMPWQTRVLVDVANMGWLMAESDLAIGAAGSTSWERCCLGLPTIMLVLAENQRLIANSLAAAGAVELIEPVMQLSDSLPRALSRIMDNMPKTLEVMSEAAHQITDGLGLEKILVNITEFNVKN